MANGRGAGRGKRDSGRDGDLFMAVPLVYIDSIGWRRARPESKSFLIDFVAPMYRKGGLPNGALMANRERLAALGYRSVSAVMRNIEDLIDCGLIARTRQGGNRVPSLYGVTWADLGPTIDRFVLDLDRTTWHTVYRGAYNRPTKPESARQDSRTAAARAARKASASATKGGAGAIAQNATTGLSDIAATPRNRLCDRQQATGYVLPDSPLEPNPAVSGDCGTDALLEMPSVQPATALVQQAAKGSKPRAAPTRKRAEANP